jgi:hypothetical protein
MTETRLSHWRGGTPLRMALAAVVLVFLAASALPAQPSSNAPQTPAGAAEATTPQSDVQQTDDLSGAANECPSPSTQQWVLIAVGTLAIFIFCFFLLVRLVQRWFIRRDKNASLGRHSGISLTFFLSSLGMVGLAYLIIGCLNRQFLLWLCFPLALWVIHGAYTLVVARSE